MKTNHHLYSQLNYLPRTAIEREQKQFIKIAFAVHLSAVISAERYRSDSVALKRAVFNFVFFVMLKNKIEQSAKTKLLLNSPTDMPFGNRHVGCKEREKINRRRTLCTLRINFFEATPQTACIFSKEMTHTNNHGDNEEQKAKRYYYHSDHLGSAQFVTDWKGRQYEHIEYTPYGELWIEEVAAGLDKLPFRFTGKELDEETGLYYYGARYLDPKYSRWLSGDPALGEYIPQAPVNDEAKKHNENLPGLGGVYNTVNLHVYHYAGNNPVKYVDPDGKKIIVGITIAKTGIDLFGQHAFIMAIDEKNPKNSVMLDASGQYGGTVRSSDIISGEQYTITVQAYLNYWDSDEKLITFEFDLTEADEKKIKTMILNIEGRSFLSCASKASLLLKDSGLFKGINYRSAPKKLLKDLQDYAKKNPGKVIKREYDMKTNKEIVIEIKDNKEANKKINNRGIYDEK
nr:RHS repeat-associated core domain-containing protein [Treponema putidum]